MEEVHRGERVHYPKELKKRHQNMACAALRKVDVLRKKDKRSAEHVMPVKRMTCRGLVTSIV